MSTEKDIIVKFESQFLAHSQSEVHVMTFLILAKVETLYFPVKTEA